MRQTWLTEWEKRKHLGLECQRVVHLNPTPLRADKLGEVLSGLWFADQLPDSQTLQDFAKFAAIVGTRHWFLRLMVNRGKNPLERETLTSPDCPKIWQASENQIKYLFKLDEGTSPGLFLDHRQMRAWVKKEGSGKSVLNLFAYTGGFSLAAALGGAKEVATVDLSGKYLNWSKENFEINGFAETSFKQNSFEFWKADSFIFLQGASKRGRRFDMIICDPPSFSRSADRTFKIEKDYAELLDLCVKCLNPNGTLLFSCNYEGWTDSDFKKGITAWNKKNQLAVEFPKPQVDFEAAGEDPILHCALLKKT